MGNSEQNCVNQTNIKLDNVSYIENTVNDVVTTQIILLPHDKCKTGNKITIKRPTNFKTLEMSYTLKDNKGIDSILQYNYELKNTSKEKFGNTIKEIDNFEGCGLNMNIIILLLIIVLLFYYIYKSHKA